MLGFKIQLIFGIGNQLILVIAKDIWTARQMKSGETSVRVRFSFMPNSGE